MNLRSTGKCYLCRKEFSKSGMTRHLKACLAKNILPEKRKGLKESLHVQVEGRHLPQYWMHLEVSGGITLADLDFILREIWLECCGHLSAFYIRNEYYSIQPTQELDDRSMNYSLTKVLQPGEFFTYQYDFGSTTELTLRLVGKTGRYLPKNSFIILARNNPPQYSCDHCKEVAWHVCVECIYEDEGFLCQKCADEHECGDDMLLPLVNSPRSGVCAYMGSAGDEGE